jgi:hypothetical protein
MAGTEGGGWGKICVDLRLLCATLVMLREVDST